MDGCSASSQVGCVEPGGVRPPWGPGAGAGQALWTHTTLLPSYEFMRRSLIFYRNEIQKMTGKVRVGAGVGVGGLLGLGSCRPPPTIVHPHRIPWSSSAYQRRPGSS